MTTDAATGIPEFTWRKTRDGQWVVCGNARELRRCAKTHTAVNVTKRSGEVQWVQIDHVSKTFGDGLAYGYIADAPAPRTTRRSGTGSCDNCQERPGRHERTDSSGIGGLVCHTCHHEPDYALSFA